jgi:hypothetical protein
VRVHSVVLSVAILVAATAAADVYRVRNTDDSGPDSLRWAIDQANKHAGPDRIVFAARLAGEGIRPLTALPRIQGSRTVIDADINADGRPDIALNGKKLAVGSGLHLWHATHCRISGLAIIGFPSSGIVLHQADYSTVNSCHVGVNLAGTKRVPNRVDDIRIELSSRTTIGGGSPVERNIIGSGELSVSFGIRVTYGSANNTIAGNYLGLNRDGTRAFGGMWGGVQVNESRENAIEGNVFAGYDRCVELADCEANVVAGNYFGLAADGDSLLPIDIGVMVRHGSTGNTIGGRSAAARNVFAGNADNGVRFIDSGTKNNRVRGNYFGLNAAGTRQRRIRQCVTIAAGYGLPGRQVIGGGTPAAGNYFTPKDPSLTLGVATDLGCGHNSVIQHNTFGVLPDGTNATAMVVGVDLCGVSALVTDNTFARATRGISVYKAGASPRIFRNTFRGCKTGVSIDDGGHCLLGNLSNPGTGDDGGNIFRKSNTWYIRNLTANRITAEGNRFGTTSRAAIDAKIWDRSDNTGLGRVDFDPLAGGVVPSGEIVPLVVASATALPTRLGGAEIAFSLSAPANVTVGVFNIAGRPVATLMRDNSAGAGLQRVIWSGQADRGTRVPNGTYLVQIVARDDEGRQAQSLCSLWLGR